MKLSIITVSYNAEKEIERTLKSIYDQMYKDYEHIIIDGASTDKTIEIIKKYKQENTVFISEKDKGIYHAMNKGIKLAQGEYLLFLNAGDKLYSGDSLSKAIKEINNEDIIVGSFLFTRFSGSTITVNSKKRIDLPFQFENGSIPHPSTFIKKSLFVKFGLYDESFKISGDYDFFARVLYGQDTSFKLIDVMISVFYEGGISTDKTFKCLLKEEDRLVKINNIYNTRLYKNRFWKRKIRMVKKYPLFFLNLFQMIEIIKA